MSMEGMFGQAKKAVSDVVGRATWEAERQLRTTAKQREIDQMQKQRNTITDELAGITLRLYRQGSISNAQIAGICSKIEQLDKDMNERLGQLNAIKSENFQAGDFAGAGTGMGSTVPPVAATPPPTPPPTPPVHSAPAQPDAFAGQSAGSSAAAHNCPSCGQPTRPGALYCRNCGAKMI